MTSFAEYIASQTPRTLSKQSELDLRKSIRDHIANLRRAGMTTQAIRAELANVFCDMRPADDAAGPSTPGIPT